MPFVLTQSVMRMPAVVFVVVLVMICGGCGSSVPEGSATQQSPAMVRTSQAEKAIAPPSLPTSDMTMGVVV
jgi:hypothetical protein